MLPLPALPEPGHQDVAQAGDELRDLVRGSRALVRTEDLGLAVDAMEVEDEVRWQATFAKSQDVLARLANDARAEIARGDVSDFDPASNPE